MLLGAVAAALAVAACGRTDPLIPRPPLPVRAGPFDGGEDAGVDAGRLGDGAVVELDGGPCALQVHAVNAAGHRPIDVLFVIDNSCSMSDDQAALASNAGSFFNTFTASQADFHLGVVTTTTLDRYHGGVLVGPYLTRATPNLYWEFQNLVVQGSDGYFIERALLAADSALSEPVLSSINTGFIRPDADLALVFLGDEDDQSTVDVRGFATHLKTLKSSTDVTVAGILGLVPASQGCDAQYIDRWRLTGFTREFGTHGLLAICTNNYASTLSLISGAIVNARCTFELATRIDFARPVKVTVDGAPSQFTYHPPPPGGGLGSLEIVPCPQSGALVVISYDDGTCP